MKKCYATLLLAALCSTATLAQQQDSLITQPAAGETINLYRTTTGYESVYYYAVDHQSTGDWQRMVFGEDGAVYLENPINSIYTQTWTRTYCVSPSNWGGDSQNKSNISPTYLKNKIYEEKNYSGIDSDDEPCLCHGTEVGYHGTTLLELQRDQ